MNDIGLLGGSFDPVHYGHTTLAQVALDEIHLRELIIMPTYMQPHKHTVIEDNEHRLNMVRLAFDETIKDQRLKVSTYEMDKADISYTFNTVDHLRAQYPRHKIWLIMGSDSIFSIENWYKGCELLKICNLGVSRRPDEDNHRLDEWSRNLTAKYGTEISIFEGKLPAISSTRVRECIQGDKPISDLVPQKVEKYILQHNLYKPDERHD